MSALPGRIHCPLYTSLEICLLPVALMFRNCLILILMCFERPCPNGQEQHPASIQFAMTVCILSVWAETGTPVSIGFFRTLLCCCVIWMQTWTTFEVLLMTRFCLQRASLIFNQLQDLNSLYMQIVSDGCLAEHAGRTFLID
mmetsp:Transcript_8537/g.9845  ORF Transcript_8537/g.9845 Transcript_8537/m.9845 type:complete len:142 (-) Transcript_8537:73-498(-)